MAPDSPGETNKVKIDVALFMQTLKEIGWTQESLAEKAGIGKNTVSNMKTTGEASIATVKLVAAKLGLTYKELTGKKPKNNRDEDEGFAVKRKGRTIYIRLKVPDNVPAGERYPRSKQIADAICAAFNFFDGRYPDDDLNSQSGSLSFTMCLTPRDAKNLMDAFLEGELAQFNVVSVTASAEPGLTIPSDSVKPTPKNFDLATALELHEKWLNNPDTGVQFKWRFWEQKPLLLRHELLSPANQCGPSLSGRDLRRADLTREDLSGIDLNGTDLSGANLTGTNLSDADLTDADFTEANMNLADLSHADLRGALLKKAFLVKADLTSAKCKDADFSDAFLRYANLTNTNLVDANLKEADLRDTNLSGSDLQHALSMGAVVSQPPEKPMHIV